MSNEAEIKDPVCGKPVDPLRARAVGIYGGVTHYFCSAACKERYADPRQAPGGGPQGLERRWSDGTGSGGASDSSEWFSVRAAEPTAERFADLETTGAPPPEPTPSLLEAVAATRGPGRTVLVVALALVGIVLLVLGLWR